jgi:hypothetical protein
MKKIMPKVAALMFGAFLVGMFLLVISLTFSALGRIFPESFTNQLIGLVLFDLAALAWGLAFVYQSQSTGQYAISAIGFLVGIVGTIVMIASEVMLSAEGLVEPPDWIGRTLAYGFIVASVLHLILGYMHKAASPDIDASIRLGAAQAEVTSEAIKQAESEIEANRAAMGQVIRGRLVADIHRNLDLPIPADPDMPFLPAKEYRQATRTERATVAPSFLTKIRGKFKRTPPPSPVTYEQTAPMVEPSYHPVELNPRPEPSGSSRPLYNEHTYGPQPQPKQEDQADQAAPFREDGQ